MNNNINPCSGLTDEQVLAGITKGDIHPDSRIVAQHRLAPQAIFWALPPPRCMVGCLAKIPPDTWQEIFPKDPYPQDE